MRWTERRSISNVRARISILTLHIPIKKKRNKNTTEADELFTPRVPRQTPPFTQPFTRDARLYEWKRKDHRAYILKDDLRSGRIVGRCVRACDGSEKKFRTSAVPLGNWKGLNRGEGMRARISLSEPNTPSARIFGDIRTADVRSRTATADFAFQRIWSIP